MQKKPFETTIRVRLGSELVGGVRWSISFLLTVLLGEREWSRERERERGRGREREKGERREEGRGKREIWK
eukprot:1367708-Amorphochlora_amoeboformis.AAC.1